MGKKKTSGAAIKASRTKRERANAASAANPVRVNEVERPPKAAKAVPASAPASQVAVPATGVVQFRRGRPQ